MLARLRAALAARRAQRDTVASADPQHNARVDAMYRTLAIRRDRV